MAPLQTACGMRDLRDAPPGPSGHAAQAGPARRCAPPPPTAGGHTRIIAPGTDDAPGQSCDLVSSWEETRPQAGCPCTVQAVHAVTPGYERVCHAPGDGRAASVKRQPVQVNDSGVIRSVSGLTSITRSP